MIESKENANYEEEEKHHLPGKSFYDDQKSEDEKIDDVKIRETTEYDKNIDEFLEKGKKPESFSMRDVIKLARSMKVPFGNVKKQLGELMKDADKAAEASDDPHFDKKAYMNERLANMRKK